MVLVLIEWVIEEVGEEDTPNLHVRRGRYMFCYLMKIVIKPYKSEEFIKTMRSLSAKIRKEKGCAGYKVYQDSEEENTFTVVGEWKTHQAMENHFQTKNYEVLLGAARVLGEHFEMNIDEVKEAGGYEMARGQIQSPQTVA